MRVQEFQQVCDAVASGEAKRVQNLDLLYVGEVVACDRDRNRVEVEAFGHRFEWSAERCRAVDPRVSALGPPTDL
jgi:hypothetical protein